MLEALFRDFCAVKRGPNISYLESSNLCFLALISTDDLTFRVFSNGTIMGTCDICNTDYNTDNWEPGLMTIFVTWQLIVTLDSIRNSCDVFLGASLIGDMNQNILCCWHVSPPWCLPLVQPRLDFVLEARIVLKSHLIQESNQSKKMEFCGKNSRVGQGVMAKPHFLSRKRIAFDFLLTFDSFWW